MSSNAKDLITVGKWLEDNDGSKEKRFTTWLTSSGIDMKGTFVTESSKIDPNFVTAWATSQQEFDGVIMKFNYQIKIHKSSGM